MVEILQKIRQIPEVYYFYNVILYDANPKDLQ